MRRLQWQVDIAGPENQTRSLNGAGNPHFDRLSYLSPGRLTLEQRAKVSGRMEDADYIYGLCRRIVNDQIGEHTPEFHRLVSEVFAAVARAGRIRDEAKAVRDSGQHITGGAFSILLDQVCFDLG
jgi:hypothetical protein